MQATAWVAPPTCDGSADTALIAVPGVAASAPMPATDRAYVVVVPVKPPAYGKSRLAPLGGEVRHDLARAIALDTVEAVAGCAFVARVLVTTDDADLADDCRALGAEVVPDGAGADLNATLVQAAREAVRRESGDAQAVSSPGVVALCADLPSLRPDDLADALAEVPGHQTAYVPDAAGTGTTLFAATDLESFAPRFGPDSAARHERAGAARIGMELPRLRADVDAPAEIERALDLGVGPRTAAVLAGLVD